MTKEYKPHIVVIPRADTSRELSVEPCTELSVPRASSAERVLLVPEPGKPVVASFALEIPLVIRPLGACCNSRSLKSGRKRKKRPTHESRFPLRPRPTATPWPVPWLAKAMAEQRAQACYRHRQTSHARAGGPTTLHRRCRREAQNNLHISFCANSSCSCGHCHATPHSLVHGGMYGACTKQWFALMGGPGREEFMQKQPQLIRLGKPPAANP